MGITIEDIANKAGVSIATVSRVINGSKPVSNELRLKVMSAIDECNFKPNALAKGLVTRTTHIIGIVLPDIGNPVFGNLIKGLNRVVSARGYTLMITDSEGKVANERKLLDIMAEKQADGVIFAGVHIEDDLIRFMKEKSFPIVLVSNMPCDGSAKMNTVLLNNTLAVGQAIDYLFEKGHRRIAYIGGPEHDYSSGYLRLLGYQEALHRQGLEFETNLVRYGDFTYDSGYALMQSIVKTNLNLPTAVFAASDVMAAGALNYLHDQGIRIPEEVSVMGLDDSPVAVYTRPALTTIRFSYIEEGVKAASLLLDMIDGRLKDTAIHYVPHQIIERQSVGRR